MALNNAITRFKNPFGEQVDAEYEKQVNETLHAARVTVVEHHICEALFLSLRDMTSAISNINQQIRLCSALVDVHGNPDIIPAEHLHATIWSCAQRVINRQPLEA